MDLLGGSFVNNNPRLVLSSPVLLQCFEFNMFAVCAMFTLLRTNLLSFKNVLPLNNFLNKPKMPFSLTANVTWIICTRN